MMVGPAGPRAAGRYNRVDGLSLGVLGEATIHNSEDLRPHAAVGPRLLRVQRRARPLRARGRALGTWPESRSGLRVPRPDGHGRHLA